MIQQQHFAISAAHMDFFAYKKHNNPRKSKVYFYSNKRKYSSSSLTGKIGTEGNFYDYDIFEDVKGISILNRKLIEDRLGIIENRALEFVKIVSKRIYTIGNEDFFNDLEPLDFAHFANYLFHQFIRTKKTREFLEKTELAETYNFLHYKDIAKEQHLTLLLDNKFLMENAKNLISNCKWLFFRNETSIPLITGDVGIIFTNNYAYYPITPRLGLRIYKNVNVENDQFLFKTIIRDENVIDDLNSIISACSDIIIGGETPEFLLRYSHPEPSIK